ncbi:MAG: SDR family oxidoreductase [Myxococcales bacterium]|jgi:thioester reductase-like protein|nr:SDR family oxidoreductase [Myxococcales bacterium]
MAIFLTGATGYIGSYVAASLLEQSNDRLALLVRAKSPAEAEERLWKSMQLHLDFDRFLELVRTRCDLYLGDLTFPELGLAPEARDKLVRTADSVLHIAASLNRKSSKVCFNVNLRGTLSVIKLARDAQDHHGLRRFTDISTVAVAGERKDEVVSEENTVDWDKSDYDPYARTKKFCEHMLHELLPDVHGVVLRPSIVLGDSRFPETTQFDMVRAFAMLAQLPLLPFDPDWRLDIVPADYVCKAIVKIHQADKPQWDAYNLSSGTASLTYRQITRALEQQGHPVKHRFAPWLNRTFTLGVDGLAATPRGWGVALPASLMKVFLPYLTFNTVFDNSRVVAELGEAPRPFDEYALPLLRFALGGKFTYPYKPWPGGAQIRQVA